MRIPTRIALPVVTALLLAGGILVFFFLQLEHTRALLTAELLQETATGSSAHTQRTIPDLLPLDADGALLHLRRGDVHALRGDWKNAEKEYAQAVQKDGGLPALRKLVQAQIQRRDMKAARDTLDQLRRVGASSDDLLLWESSIALRTGELTKAQGLLSGAAASPQQQYGLGLLFLITGKHEEARAALRETANGWESVLRAHARMILSAYEEYALFPDSPEIHLQTLLSRALADAGECELALPMLSRVTRAKDDYRDAWIVRGFCELTTERPDEALASLEQAYRIDPQKPEIQYFLARAYGDQGDHANALTFLQYALRNAFQPEAEVRQLLATEALHLGQVALALEQYATLTRLPGATMETMEQYIHALLAADKPQEALLQAEEAHTRWPNDPRARTLLEQTRAATTPQDA